MEDQKLIPNLFRSEFAKIVSVLSKTYGINNIQLAEDITSDTFMVASETWSLKGIPENPKAWLYSVAKNKSKDYFKRSSIFSEKITPDLVSAHEQDDKFEIDLSEGNIEDSQLKMLFAICDPNLSKEAQITLSLRILCGLGIQEIASALLSTKSTINKRLLRAKAAFKKHNIKLELPLPAEQIQRKSDVLRIIYLLFNEGYYSSTTESNTRKHLCVEAMNLLYILLKSLSSTEANAMMALFCFHASRFDAREDDLGNPILFEDQDISKWSQELILKGENYIQKSATGNSLSKYHLEAYIAFWHCKHVHDENKWDKILQFYNHLLQIEYSPITALNRTYALSKVHGKEKALQEAIRINLQDHLLYHTLLAELYKGQDSIKEIEHLHLALNLAKTNTERTIIESKIILAKESI